MKLLNSLLIIEKEERTILDVMVWWELKRVLYNLIILFFGMLSLEIMSLTIELELGEDIIEPIVIIGFAILSNCCYTLGWLTEIVIENNSKDYGPIMFKRGLLFSIVIVIIPGVFHLINWVAS